MDFDDITIPDDYDPFAPAPISTTAAAKIDQPTTDNNSKDNETKPKRIQKVKLDETLLLGTKGLSRIRYEAPFIQFKGRGHAADDLKRLMQFYQRWAHNLYPRLRFQDFASRVVKVTPKKRCKVSLTEWQREYKEKRQERQREKEAVEEEFSGMRLDDENVEKRIDDLNAEIFGGNNDGSVEKEHTHQPRESTIIENDDDDTDMDQDAASSDDDDQPLFIKPKPRQIIQEEEDDSVIEERRRQKNSRADALAALIARRNK
ncbi:Swi3-domain-containing protein [Backusella circina FSU 941]|nr:Swi3-domain-containing protein [Backusella circina FSU 941]